MPLKPTKGTKQYLFELDPVLMEKLDALAAEMGRTRKAELVMAIERHLAYPPQKPEPPPKPPVDPLPDVPKRGRGRPRKKE